MIQGDAPYSKLSSRGGVYRVQRVPVTESQVASSRNGGGLPEAERGDIEIKTRMICALIFIAPVDTAIQSVNTTDSAVRILARRLEW